MCSPANFDPEHVIGAVDLAEVVQVTITAHYDHTDNPEIKIQLHENPDDIPSGVQYSATVHDITKMHGNPDTQWSSILCNCA
jgi:hypothetical protein